MKTDTDMLQELIERERTQDTRMAQSGMSAADFLALMDHMDRQRQPEKKSGVGVAFVVVLVFFGLLFGLGSLAFGTGAVEVKNVDTASAAEQRPTTSPEKTAKSSKTTGSTSRGNTANRNTNAVAEKAQPTTAPEPTAEPAPAALEPAQKTVAVDSAPTYNDPAAIAPQAAAPAQEAPPAPLLEAACIEGTQCAEDAKNHSLEAEVQKSIDDAKLNKTPCGGSHPSMLCKPTAVPQQVDLLSAAGIKP